MPRGGSRIGSGQKGKAKPSLSAAAVSGNPLVNPPSHLPADVADVWSRLAPKAIRQQTLTPEKVDGFEQLCRLVILDRTIDTWLASGDYEGSAKVALLGKKQKAVEQVRDGYQRFRLTGDGRPDAAAAPKTEVKNPWGI